MMVQDNGAAAVTFHGRTKSMLYSGRADWDTIREVKKAVSVPVIANGDIFGPDEAIQCIRRTGADLVMIGRSAFGNPWVFRQTKAALEGLELPEIPPLSRRIDVAVRQIELAKLTSEQRVDAEKLFIESRNADTRAREATVKALQEAERLRMESEKTTAELAMKLAGGVKNTLTDNAILCTVAAGLMRSPMSDSQLAMFSVLRFKMVEDVADSRLPA